MLKIKYLWHSRKLFKGYEFLWYSTEILEQFPAWWIYPGPAQDLPRWHIKCSPLTQSCVSLPLASVLALLPSTFPFLLCSHISFSSKRKEKQWRQAGRQRWVSPTTPLPNVTEDGLMDWLVLNITEDKDSWQSTVFQHPPTCATHPCFNPRAWAKNRNRKKLERIELEAGNTNYISLLSWLANSGIACLQEIKISLYFIYKAK